MSLPVATGATYTLTADDYTYFLNKSNLVTLPTAVGNTGRIYVIKRITNEGVGTIVTTGNEKIDGKDTFTLQNDYDFVKVQSDGANWFIIGQN